MGGGTCRPLYYHMTVTTSREEFNRRWNIEDDRTFDDRFNEFRIRIINILKGVDSHLSNEDISKFCQIVAIPEVWSYGSMDSEYSTMITDQLVSTTKPHEFFYLIEVILNLPVRSTMGYRHETTYSREMLIGKVAEAVELSKVNLAIATKPDGVGGSRIILYPAGEKYLDEKVVNYVLHFLDSSSGPHYVDALKFYELGGWRNHVRSAESLRRCLEEFLRHKLSNTLGLERNIIELRSKLKVDNHDAQVRNSILGTVKLLDQYWNENSKHNDGDIDVKENEYLIYEVGAILLYLNKSL